MEQKQESLQEAFKRRPILVSILLLIIGWAFWLAFFSSGGSSTSSTYQSPKISGTVVTVESDEFQYIDPPLVNVFKSYSDRTRVTKLERGQKVYLIGRDEENDYCHIQIGQQNGWVACGWLLEE